MNLGATADFLFREVVRERGRVPRADGVDREFFRPPPVGVLLGCEGEREGHRSIGVDLRSLGSFHFDFEFLGQNPLGFEDVLVLQLFEQLQFRFGVHLRGEFLLGDFDRLGE